MLRGHTLCLSPSHSSLQEDWGDESDVVTPRGIKDGKREGELDRETEGDILRREEKWAMENGRQGDIDIIKREAREEANTGEEVEERGRVWEE